jgi:accessory gene regulator protein AgrB
VSDNKPILAFDADDLKRRKKRSLVMALCLAALLVIIFITTVVKIYQAAHGVNA